MKQTAAQKRSEKYFEALEWIAHESRPYGSEAMQLAQGILTSSPGIRVKHLVPEIRKAVTA